MIILHVPRPTWRSVRKSTLHKKVASPGVAPPPMALSSPWQGQAGEILRQRILARVRHKPQVDSGFNTTALRCLWNLNRFWSLFLVKPRILSQTLAGRYSTVSCHLVKIAPTYQMPRATDNNTSHALLTSHRRAKRILAVQL